MSEAERYLRWLRECSPDGYLYLLAKPAKTGPVRRVFSESVDEILSAVEEVKDSHEVWIGLATYKAGGKATKTAALPTKLVWIDHDGPNADPYSWDPPPHVVVQTSEGKAQAAWIHSDDLAPRATEELCSGLAARFGADASDKDITQVHRLPGTLNFKYNPPFPVKLLWLKTTADTPAYAAQALQVATAVTPVTPVGTTGVPGVPAQGTRENALYLMGKYGVPTDAVSDLFINTQDDRSRALYKLMATLAENGAGLADIFRVASHSVNQKFDTPQRLWEDVLRADLKVSEKAGDRLVWSHASELVGIDERIEWIVPPYIYRDCVGTVVGEPSARKSWNTLQLSVAVACPEAKQFHGAPILIHGAVMYYNLDDRRARRLKLRMGNILAFYRDGNKDYDVPIRWTAGPFSYRQKRWVHNLREDIQRVQHEEGQAVVLSIFDTLHKTGFDPKDWGINASEFIDGLTDVAMDLKTAFMIVHHTTKAQAQPENVRMAPWGSVFIGASLDPTILLTRDMKEDRAEPARTHIRLWVSSKEEPEWAYPKILSYGRDTSVFDVTVSEADIDARLLVTLERAGEPISQAELARRIEETDTETARTCRRLEAKGLVSVTKTGNRVWIGIAGGVELQSEF